MKGLQNRIVLHFCRMVTIVDRTENKEVATNERDASEILSRCFGLFRKTVKEDEDYLFSCEVAMHSVFAT